MCVQSVCDCCHIICCSFPLSRLTLLFLHLLLNLLHDDRDHFLRTWPTVWVCFATCLILLQILQLFPHLCAFLIFFAFLEEAPGVCCILKLQIHRAQIVSVKQQSSAFLFLSTSREILGALILLGLEGVGVDEVRFGREAEDAKSYNELHCCLTQWANTPDVLSQ